MHNPPKHGRFGDEIMRAEKAHTRFAAAEIVIGCWP
jgi:hypothetical protein